MAEIPQYHPQLDRLEPQIARTLVFPSWVYYKNLLNKSVSLKLCKMHIQLVVATHLKNII